MHSKAKLLLAIFTSPIVAFEEIIRRRLLGTALIIIAISGTLAGVATIARGISTGPLQYFALGKENPVSWIGLCFLYAWAMMKLLNWLGVRVDFEKTVIIMGWSQISLVFCQLTGAALAIASAAHSPNPTTINLLSSASFIFLIWYVITIGFGFKAAFNIPPSRSILSYLVVASTAGIGLGVFYNLSRIRVLDPTAPGFAAAQRIIAADQTPWIIAAVVGLVIGISSLGRVLGWDAAKRSRTAVSAALLGVLALGGYMYAISNSGYFDTVLAAQRKYQKDDYLQSASLLKKLLPISTDNQTLLLDLGDTYFLAGKNAEALEYYEKSLDSLADLPASNLEVPKAQIYSRMGAVYDIDGKYDQAIKAFEKSAKLWPQFKEPWVRMAVTYNRQGNYKQAIKSANHAIQNMDSSATVAWVALAQAFIQTGDKKQAAAAIAMVAGKDPDLEKKIGEKADDWKNAVSKLTVKDLKFPLEKEVSARHVKSPEKKKVEKKSKLAH